MMAIEIYSSTGEIYSSRGELAFDESSASNNSISNLFLEEVLFIYKNNNLMTRNHIEIICYFRAQKPPHRTEQYYVNFLTQNSKDPFGEFEEKFTNLLDENNLSVHPDSFYAEAFESKVGFSEIKTEIAPQDIFNYIRQHHKTLKLKIPGPRAAISVIHACEAENISIAVARNPNVKSFQFDLLIVVDSDSFEIMNQDFKPGGGKGSKETKAQESYQGLRGYLKSNHIVRWISNRSRTVLILIILILLTIIIFISYIILGSKLFIIAYLAVICQIGFIQGLRGTQERLYKR